MIGTPCPADPTLHRLPIAQIVSDAFAGGQEVEEISRQYIGSSHYDWNTTRLIWDGERLAHHWGVWGYSMRLETARLRVAGIGAVVTAEPYRKQGLMEQAARASFQAMRANGYDLTILRGRHYARFGYVRAWNYVTYRLKATEIPASAGPVSYTMLGPERMGEIVALYNQDYDFASGTAVRPTYSMLRAEDMRAYGWFEQDRLAGYVRAVPAKEQPKTLICLEATGDPLQALAVLADLFRQGEYETLAFFTLPHRHPLLKIIRRGACVVEDQYFYHTGWQVRVVNLSSTLEKLRPLLEARLQRSHLANWTGDLYLDAGEEQAVLRIAEGQVQVVEGATGEHAVQGGPAMGRLLIGSDEPEEVMQQAGITCTGQAEELVHALFPNLHPMMSHWDEY